MLQQRKSLQLPLIGMVLLALLAGAALAIAMAARKREENENDGAGVVRHSVNTSPTDALKYWTAEKMQSAKPAKMPKARKLKPLEGGKKRSRRSDD